MSSVEVAQARNTVWDYLKLHGDVPDAVSLIVVLGSRDERVAVLAADVAHKVAASLVVVSGGSSAKNDTLSSDWAEATEAEHFAAVMRRSGCQKELILEKKASHTGENATFTQQIMQDRHIEPVSILIVTKPYMERRALRTFEKQWTYGTPKFYTISSRQTFDEYVRDSQDAELVTHVMVGDLERIIKYPERGLMTESHVPGPVLEALQILQDAGYTNHSL